MGVAPSTSAGEGIELELGVKAGLELGTEIGAGVNAGTAVATGDVILGNVAETADPKGLKGCTVEMGGRLNPMGGADVEAVLVLNVEGDIID